MRHEKSSTAGGSARDPNCVGCDDSGGRVVSGWRSLEWGVWPPRSRGLRLRCSSQGLIVRAGVVSLSLRGGGRRDRRRLRGLWSSTSGPLSQAIYLCGPRFSESLAALARETLRDAGRRCHTASHAPDTAGNFTPAAADAQRQPRRRRGGGGARETRRAGGGGGRQASAFAGQGALSCAALSSAAGLPVHASHRRAVPFAAPLSPSPVVAGAASLLRSVASVAATPPVGPGCPPGLSATPSADSPVAVQEKRRRAQRLSSTALLPLPSPHCAPPFVGRLHSVAHHLLLLFQLSPSTASAHLLHFTPPPVSTSPTRISLPSSSPPPAVVRGCAVLVR